jgi:hypothetical protein
VLATLKFYQKRWPMNVDTLQFKGLYVGAFHLDFFETIQIWVEPLNY